MPHIILLMTFSIISHAHAEECGAATLVNAHSHMITFW